MPGYQVTGDSLKKLKESGFAGARSSKPGAGGPKTAFLGPYKKPSTDRRAVNPNDEIKRADEIAALSYFQFDSLDRKQVFANASETIPIVFCFNENNKGGVWVSPPLIDQHCSATFDHDFAYLLSQGAVETLGVVTKDAFIGKEGIAGLTEFGVTLGSRYTWGSDSCPYLGSDGLSCQHDTFSTAIDSLPVAVGSKVTHRVVDQYASKVTIRIKPLRKDETSQLALNTYNILISRMTLDGLSGNVTLIGQEETSSVGGITEIVDTSPGNGFIYLIENVLQVTNTGEEPEMFLMMVEQENNWPESMDRAKDYGDITLLVASGNLYNAERAFSDPKDLKQLHIYIRNGMYVDKWRFDGGDVDMVFDSSNKIGDLLNNYVDKSGNFGSLNFMSKENLAEVAEFHSNYDLTFNGVVPSGTNFLSWAQQIAPYFLCVFFVRSATYTLKPVLPLDDVYEIDTGALTPLEAFDDKVIRPDSIANAIIVESYEKTYVNNQDRAPFQALVSYREQNEYGLETIQTVSVRYSDYDREVPEEAFDLSTFATNAAQCELFAKYLLATRRFSTHRIVFDTPRNAVTASDLSMYDLISLSLTRTNSAGDNRVETDYYLVTGMISTQGGILSITAEHFPLNSDMTSIISNSIISGSFEISV